jgi:hypothetical protein
MPQARLLSRLFEMNYGALFRNLEGITREEALVRPERGGNCINWVTGHIVASRNNVLTLLDHHPIWPKPLAHLYSGRDDSGWTNETAADFDIIRADLARSQKTIMAALDSVDARGLSKRSENGRTLAEVLGFFQFHEAYHAGQVGVLRRIVGKQGAIRAPGRATLLGDG